MDITEIPQIVRNADRFREVVTILAKHGLADWLSAISPSWLEWFRRNPTDSESVRFTTEQRIRIALTELGTTFIKIGQILSTRPDIVGYPLADELAQLRTDTPADAPEVAIGMIESELGRSINELFADFEPLAMASASIGQVHRARTHDDRDVVVKVQHPDIQQRSINDLEIMVRLAQMAEQYSAALRQFRPVQTARQLQKSLMHEMDFVREQRNMQRFSQNFKHNPSVRFAEPIPGLCSRRVLTMTYLKGISVSKKDELASLGIDLAEVAMLGANVFLDMIFRDSFYHADPHPGNIIVMSQSCPDDGAPVVGILDCGMVGRVDDSIREDLELVLIAASQQDATTITEVVARVGDVPVGFDETALLYAIQDFLDEYTHQRLDQFDLSGCLNGIIDTIREHHIFLPARIAMLLKVFVMLEGTAQQLNPTFSLAELIQPYGQQAMRNRYSPQRMVGNLKSSIRDWNRLIGLFPKDMADILHNFKRGRFDIHLDHRRLEPIVNRLVMGILTAALFVGSASLCSYEVPPAIDRFSIPGFLGCAVAVYMGWSIKRDIQRTNKNDGSPPG